MTTMTNKLNIVHNMPVFSLDDHKLGYVSKIVLDPDSADVSYLVIERGFIFTDDKLVPMSLVLHNDGGKLRLSQKQSELPELADFEPTYFVSVEANTPESPTVAGGRTTLPAAFYHYPPLLTQGMGGALIAAMREATAQHTQHLLNGDVSFALGCAVISREGEQVGTLAQVLIHPDLTWKPGQQIDMATHVLVSSGLFGNKKTLIPIIWIDKLEPERVVLTIDKAMFERLVEFTPETAQ